MTPMGADVIAPSYCGSDISCVAQFGQWNLSRIPSELCAAVKRTHTGSYSTQGSYLHVSCTLRDVLVCTYMPTMYCLLCTLDCKDA